MVKKQYIKAEIRKIDIDNENDILATSTVEYAGTNKLGGPTQAETKRSMWDDEEW